MNQKTKLFFSNYLEVLADHLRDEFLRNPSFKEQIVIIDNQHVKNWLMERFATDLKMQIAMGWIFFTPQQAIQHFSNQIFPNKLEISLAIENKIQEHAKDFPQLFSYLDLPEDKRQKRLASISDHLADLFIQYGIFYHHEWEKSSTWQEKIFYEIFYQDKWLFPIRDLKDAKNNGEIHCFGLSYLPQTFFSFFNSLSAKHYILSPCLHFWEDIRSDRERVQLRKFWKRKKVAADELEQLDQYLRDRNTLLANWGILGRKYLEIINNENFSVCDQYIEPSSRTLLGKIQNDILFLSEKHEAISVDQTLRIIQAPSRLREIEILHESLLQILDQEKVFPNQICVLAPDIQIYAPYIHYVFDNIPYRISDLEISAQSYFAQGMLLLVQLARSRWEREDLFSLLENPSLQKKFFLQKEEVSLLIKWFKKMRVDWGINEEQRSFFLQTKTQFPCSWEHGVQRLLSSLIFFLNDAQHEAEFSYPFPLEGVEISHAKIIEKLIHLFHSLQNDLQIFLQSWTLEKWAEHLERIATKYFFHGEEDESIAYNHFKGALIRLHHASEKHKKRKYPYSSILLDIERSLQKPIGTYGQSENMSVSFRSLQSGAIVPFQVIVLLGMDQTTFPKPIKFDAWDREKKRPKEGEKDRYLFLEALLSARKLFWISYSQESLPSLFVSELLNYCEKTYAIQQKDLMEKHPSLSFDLNYLASKPVYSSGTFAAAKAHYFSPIFRDSIFSQSLPENPIPKEIFLQDLLQFSRNPIKYYLKNLLGIQLYDNDQEELFSLSALMKHQFKQEVLSEKVSLLLKIAEKKGELPFGPFSDIAKEQLQKEAEGTLSALKQWGIDGLVEEELAQEIQYNEQQICIRGKVANVSEKGMVILEEENNQNKIKFWPQILLYRCSHNKEILFTKNQKSWNPKCDPKQLLEKYIRYYLSALQKPSFFLPKWSNEILNNDRKGLRKKIENLHSSYSGYTDPYVKWLYMQNALPSADEILQYQEIYASTFSLLRS